MNLKKLRRSLTLKISALLTTPLLLLLILLTSSLNVVSLTDSGPEDEVQVQPNPRYKRHPEVLTNLTDLNSLLLQPTGTCHKLAEVGGTWYCQGFDGNKDVCFDPWYTPAYNSCIIYSFGVGSDISFETLMSEVWGCTVFMYDHTVNHTEEFYGPKHVHKPWGIARQSYTEDGVDFVSYRDALIGNGHLDAQVHYLKIDIEGDEFNVLPDMIQSGLLRNVWQIHMEIHVFNYENESDVSHLARQQLAYDIIQRLENSGFRRVRTTVNNILRYEEPQRWPSWCCSDVLWVNYHRHPEAEGKMPYNNGY